MMFLNDRGLLWISLNIRSIILNIYQCCIDISSQNINLVSHISSIRWLCARILQIKSDYISINILNREWIVVPSFSNIAIISKNTIINAIPSSNRILINIKLIRNIFPILSNSLKKNTSPSPDAIIWQRISKIILWSTLKHAKSRFIISYALYACLSSINRFILRIIDANSCVNAEKSYLSRSKLFW